MKRLLLVGGGGHCKSVLDTLLSSDSKYDNIGIVDIEKKVGTSINGIKVIGTDFELQKLYDEGYKYAFISLGSIGCTNKRKELCKQLENIGFNLPTIIDKESIVGKNVYLGQGTFIGKGVIINVDTFIGQNAIINSGAIIEHECNIGDYTHIAPGSVICGNVDIGNSVHVGANSTIIQGIKIGESSMIGAGSTIIKNVDKNIRVVGTPGRVIR